jgi:hypothetical protein
MRSLPRAYRLPALSVLIVGAALSLSAQSLAATTAHSSAATAALGSAAHGPRPAGSTAAAVVRPRAFGELDCNGLSPTQKPLKQTLACADPRGGDEGRFEEHGHYIGHDEPSVRFLSKRRGSGNNTTFTERLPKDPTALPTVKKPGKDVTHWFELSIAPWFSTTVCDGYSAPLLPCTPRSDQNAPAGRYPGGGAAFVELQLYPPGFAPFVDSISCDNTHWCAALNIDSLECKGNGSGACNGNCVEPVNFGFLQTNGVPTGPPSPQLSNLATFTSNSKTLLMNPGDRIRVHMWDAKIKGGRALETRITDLTTGKTGWMIASAHNGFMDTNPFNCNGRPFNFQPEYNTARAANIIPWGIGPYMINDEYEVGHFEACTKVTGKATVDNGGGFTDTYYKNCEGPYEAKPDSSDAFEPDDSPCYTFGDTHGRHAAPNLVTGCDVFFDAIGDLDYDGSPYWPDWPDSVKAGPFPSPFLQLQPTTTGGHRYPRIQFMTDSSATQFNTDCNLSTGKGCVLPPKGPGHFYPFFTQARVKGACVWEFGNMTNGRDFHRDKQYGKVGPGTIGAFVGRIRQNPQC